MQGFQKINLEAKLKEQDNKNVIQNKELQVLNEQLKEKNKQNEGSNKFTNCLF